MNTKTSLITEMGTSLEHFVFFISACVLDAIFIFIRGNKK